MQAFESHEHERTNVVHEVVHIRAVFLNRRNMLTNCRNIPESTFLLSSRSSLVTSRTSAKHRALDPFMRDGPLWQQQDGVRGESRSGSTSAAA